MDLPFLLKNPLHYYNICQLYTSPKTDTLHSISSKFIMQIRLGRYPSHSKFIKLNMKIIKLIAYKIATIYWKIFRPQTFGVKLLLINDNKVLLVEHSYTKGYHLPGGGVKSGEMFDRALKREILEELGLDISNLELFGVYQNTKQGKIDTVITYLSTNPVDLNKAKLSSEINHANFYRLDRLPTNISPGSRKRIQEYLSNNFPITRKW